MSGGNSGEGMPERADRRELLRALGAFGVAGLAGCPSAPGAGTDASDETPADTPDGTATDAGTTAQTDAPTDAPTDIATDAPTDTATDEPTDTATDEPTDTAAEDESEANDDSVRPDPDAELNVLVLSATAGWRHAAIETGNRAIRDLVDEVVAAGTVASASVDVVDDPDGDASAFPASAEALAGYDAVVWNNTTGSVLDADQRAAFEGYIGDGGGYVGLHAAADTHYDWNWYGDLVGAWFDDHSDVVEGTVTVTDRAHPSTDHLSARWEGIDEWYDYRRNPRGDVHVLATVDEDTYDGAAMAGGRADHPIAWCHEFAGGRSWYTGRGHTEESFRSDAYRQHVRGGIEWAAGLVDGDATGTVWDSYDRTTLETDLTQPMNVDVAPDGRVFVTERAGRVSVLDGETGRPSTALELPVYNEQEDGLVGFALDPAFAETNWAYIYYSPPDAVVGTAPYNQLSRFTVDGRTIDRDSEVELLRVHTQRATCCHTGGDIAFGPDGDLYLTVGDDTNAFESSGYAPLDERPGHEHNDSQRTAANTADLRGSILRIRPNDDGTYDVPDDNLFTEARGYGDEIAAGTVRPEIFVMGVRNPFTATVDHETGWLYFADYGPDAGDWSADRGPPGIVEFNQVREAGNFGWPYLTGPNVPYRDYDFAAGESGPAFDPDGPVNDSPNSDGLEQLPPSRPATLYYPRNWNGFFDAPDYVDLPHDRPPQPELSGGGSPMAGPVYRHDDAFGDDALPPSFDGKHFVMEWGRSWLKYVSFDEEGDVLEVDPFLPDADLQFPMDLSVGPDGALYLLEFGGWDGEEGTRLSRIDHEPA